MVDLETKLENLAHGATASFKNWADLDVTVEQFLEIIKSQPERLEYFVNEVSYDEDSYSTPADGLDTCVRDVAMDAIANHVTERDWPIYGEGDMPDFHQKMKEYFG